MNNLTKTQLAERNTLNVALAVKKSDIEEAIDIYNTAMQEAWLAVETAQAEYNEAIQNANEWISGVRQEIADFISERSDKWQEGDKGQAASAWQDAYENELSELEIERPEDIEIDDLQDTIDSLDNLPESAE